MTLSIPSNNTNDADRDALIQPPRFPNVEAMVAAHDPEEPVYCLRPATMVNQVKRFLDLFPGKVLFSVKSNPHPLVLDCLYRAGIRDFEVASLHEIALVRNWLPDSEPYFMHPVKTRSAIKIAHALHGVRHFAIDHETELDKMSALNWDAPVSVLVRLATPVEGALYELSSKFGANEENAIALLKLVEARGFVPGLCFHVGSQCYDPHAYSRALAMAKRVLVASGVQIYSVNVGGGFLGQRRKDGIPDLGVFMAEIRQGIDRLNVNDECVPMCEPGYALIADAASVVTQVLLRKDNSLYINDGLYGSWNTILQHSRVTADFELGNGRSTPIRYDPDERYPARLLKT